MNSVEIFSEVFSEYEIISDTHTDVSLWIDSLTKEGFVINEKAREILHSYGGMRIRGTNEYITSPLELVFDPCFFASGDSDRLNDYNRAADDSLFPVGGMLYFTFFVGKSGTFYLASWKELYACGESFKQFLKFILSPIPDKDNLFAKMLLKESLSQVNHMSSVEFLSEVFSEYEIISDSHEKVASWIDTLINQGFTLNELAKDILDTIGGFSVRGKSKAAQMTVELNFDPLLYSKGNFSRLSEYSEFTNDALFPVGGLFEFTLLVGKSGNFYLSSQKSSQECAISFSGFMDFLINFDPNSLLYSMFKN